LAIALAKLGAQEIWATDNDPIALDEANKNVAANQVAPYVRLSSASVEALHLSFPLIVANLFSSTLVLLAQTLTSAVIPQGYAILSGIQLDQETDVLAAYPSPSWHLVTRYPKDGWVTLVIQQS
jgi:ribosomal protein L11 methyltransferase